MAECAEQYWESCSPEELQEKVLGVLLIAAIPGSLPASRYVLPSVVTACPPHS
ncbi:unnamed protein product [Natator depressus]